MNESETHTAEANDNANKECAVCLESAVQPVKLPCNHIFCFLCVKGVVIQQNKKCPLCRKAIPSDYLLNPELASKQQSSVAFVGTYQWFYEGRNGGWWQYDDHTSIEINEAYKNGDQQCEVQIAGSVYVIDFLNNRQYRKDNQSCRRRIKRDLVTIPKKGIAGLHLPGVEVTYNSEDGTTTVVKDTSSKSSTDNDVASQKKVNQSAPLGTGSFFSMLPSTPIPHMMTRIRIPSLQIPSITIPSFTLPSMAMPSMSLPSFRTSICSCIMCSAPGVGSSTAYNSSTCSCIMCSVLGVGCSTAHDSSTSETDSSDDFILPQKNNSMSNKRNLATSGISAYSNVPKKFKRVPRKTKRNKWNVH